MNDVSMCSLQETFPTVDEVNEVLTNYVQKKDMPPVVDTSEFAKETREIEYTTFKEVLNEQDDMPIGNYKFTLKKPSSNFSIRITFRWINADGENDWYAITADVVNNALTSKKFVNGHNGSTFQGLSGSMITRMAMYLNYEDGVITMPPCSTRGSYDLINYDPEETYFIESVAYASDIPSIPNDLINETTLTTKLNDYSLKSENDELKSKITALETDNNELKEAIQSINSQLNQLLNNIYTKNESDEKYLNKDNIINELNYSRIDIKKTGSLKNSFTFDEL